jgi:hypothetical protein
MQVMFTTFPVQLRADKMAQEHLRSPWHRSPELHVTAIAGPGKAAIGVVRDCSWKGEASI